MADILIFHHSSIRMRDNEINKNIFNISRLHKFRNAYLEEVEGLSPSKRYLVKAS